MPRFPRLVCIALLLTASASGLHAQAKQKATNPSPAADKRPPLPPELLAKDAAWTGELADESEGPPVLPRPSIAEPFSIGEALYNPSRVPAAVVSLLDLMRVPIVANDAPVAGDDAGLTLGESEVWGLIAMGIADARAMGEDESGPFTFADLHAAVAPLLPGTDVGELAEAYSEAYGARPQDLVPKVMMGQPILPETPLTRVQLWLLLMDGFVGPGKEPRAARAAFDAHDSRALVLPAVMRSREDFGEIRRASAPAPAAWGTARAQVPPLQSPVPGWNRSDIQSMLRVLPTIGGRIPFGIVPRVQKVHEGHGAPGKRLTLEARLTCPGRAWSTPQGKPFLIPKPPALAGRSVTLCADLDNLEILQRHGSTQGTWCTPARTDSSGAVRVAYLPKKEAANGVGTKLKDSALVHAGVAVQELIASCYTFPPELQWASKLALGSWEADGKVNLEWHSHGIDLDIRNLFNVRLELGPLGNGDIFGIDRIVGSLELQSDGSYIGIVRARANGTQHLTGLGEECEQAESDGQQNLLVVAEKAPGLQRSQDKTKFVIQEGLDDGGLLELQFRPTSQPVYAMSDKCQKDIYVEKPGYTIPFLPFNDTRWTHLGYIVKIPKEGKLVYEDNSQSDMPIGYSNWTVKVERTDEP